MGRIAKLLSFLRVTRNGAKISDVKIDPGGGSNITAEHFAPPGDDSFPLPSDYVVTAEINRTGNEAAVGYADPLNDPVALEGDKRIYGRDPDGVAINQVWLKSDGSVLVSNDNGSVLLRSDGGSIITTPVSAFEAKANGSIKGDNGNGSFELQSGGDFLVNGVKIDAAGNVTIPTSLILNGKEIAGPDHNITSGSSAPGPTGANN